MAVEPQYHNIMAASSPWSTSDQSVEVENGLSMPLNKGDIWQPISAIWYRKWKAYVAQDNFKKHQTRSQKDIDDPETLPPGPIDNTVLSGTFGDEMNRKLKKDEDYMVLPNDVANKLFEHYGGGGIIIALTIHIGCNTMLGPMHKRKVYEMGSPLQLKIRLFPIRFLIHFSTHSDPIPCQEPIVRYFHGSQTPLTLRDVETRLPCIPTLDMNCQLRLWVKIQNSGGTSSDLINSISGQSSASASAACSAAFLSRVTNKAATASTSSSSKSTPQVRSDGCDAVNSNKPSSSGVTVAAYINAIRPGQRRLLTADLVHVVDQWQLWHAETSQQCDKDGVRRDDLDKMLGDCDFIEIMVEKNKPGAPASSWPRHALLQKWKYNTLRAGDVIDALDESTAVWREATVQSMDHTSGCVHVQYRGGSNDSIAMQQLVDRIEPLYQHTQDWREPNWCRRSSFALFHSGLLKAMENQRKLLANKICDFKFREGNHLAEENAAHSSSSISQVVLMGMLSRRCSLVIASFL